MLYDADLNNDKSVSFEEFKNMLCDPKNNLSKNEASFMVKLLRKTINSGKFHNSVFMRNMKKLKTRGYIKIATTSCYQYNDTHLPK